MYVLFCFCFSLVFFFVFLPVVAYDVAESGSEYYRLLRRIPKEEESIFGN
jgi:hypothetical protein